MTESDFSTMLLHINDHLDEIKSWVKPFLSGETSLYDLHIVSAVENAYKEKFAEARDEDSLKNLRTTMTAYIGEAVLFYGGGKWFYCTQKRAYNFHHAGITGWGTGETYDLSAEGILAEIEAGEEQDLLKTQLEYIINRDELQAKSDQLFRDLMNKKD